MRCTSHVRRPIRDCVGSHRQLAAVHDGHLLAGRAAGGADSLNLEDDIHAVHHLAEHYVAAIQPAGLDRGDKELLTVERWGVSCVLS